MRHNGETWDEIASHLNILTEDGRINPGLAKRMVMDDYVPARNSTRIRIGLKPNPIIKVMGDEIIHDGCQAIYERQCACGQYFIPNHPLRDHCFICRPFRTRK
ncbi:MAG: hypothetical protein PHW24_05185 [Candidatus Moranbacteria bacterium]|nr:hypothetical protein [Candidatus Moranbacteria bacterium]